MKYNDYSSVTARGELGARCALLSSRLEAPIYRVQNTCRMRLVLKCRLTKRTRAFLTELLTEFGKAGPSRFTGGMVQTRSARRVTVSVDLNPSTV